MDPITNLQEQRRIAAAILQSADVNDIFADHRAARLAELVIALDGWISKGGFSPWGRS